MPVGISKAELLIITDILKRYANNYEFYFYGSRVHGNFEKASDLDILVKGDKEMPYCELERLKEILDESLLPYVVNFADYHGMDGKFYNSIESGLVKVEASSFEDD